MFSTTSLLPSFCVLFSITIVSTLPLSTNFNTDGRIVGGVEGSIMQFPHQVSLQTEGKHICGAVLIDLRFVLTAAHCIDPAADPTTYTVRLGSSEPYKGGFLIPVKRIIIHESYNIPSVLNNDIALIELKQNVTLSNFVRQIPLLASAEKIPADATFYVSGWGATSSSVQTVAPRLRYTAIKEINHKTCATAYHGTAFVTPMMLCAGLTRGGRDSCQGDSGGPLVTFVHGEMKLIGIVSFGIDCASATYPGVYTRVSMYNSWIEDKKKELVDA